MNLAQLTRSWWAWDGSPTQGSRGKIQRGRKPDWGRICLGKLAYQHSAIRVGKADTLAHSTCSAGLEGSNSPRKPCPRPSSCQGQRGVKMVKRKVTCREGKATPNYQRTQASTVSHCIPRGIGAEVLGLGRFHTTPKPTPGAWQQSSAGLSPSGNITPVTLVHTGQCPVHPIWVEKCWGDAASAAQHWLKLKPCSTVPRRCLHRELLKSWLKISLSHLIFLVQSKSFTCLAALCGDEHYSDGAWNLTSRAKFDLFPVSLHSDFSGCVPLTKIKLSTDRCKATQLLHLQGTKGSIFLSLRPFRWAHLMTAIFMSGVIGFIITASTTWTEVGASFMFYLIQFKSLFF